MGEIPIAVASGTPDLPAVPAFNRHCGDPPRHKFIHRASAAYPGASQARSVRDKTRGQVTLRWEWEVKVPELETSVFVVPKAHMKNGMERVVVLNHTARSVIESRRSEHRELVLTHEGKGLPKINNSGWQAARRRAAGRYEKELGRPCPDGFRNIRVYDLKHTCGYRLRAGGAQFEDWQLLLGHKTTHVTTHYSAADIGNLIAASEKVCELASRKSPAVAIVRARNSVSA